MTPLSEAVEQTCIRERSGHLWSWHSQTRPRLLRSSQATIPHRVFPELSERERGLLGLVAQGRSNQEIADQLGLTLKTVRNHVSNIFNKLQVADRTQAVLRAREAGLG